MMQAELALEWRYLVGPSMAAYATAQFVTDDGSLFVSVNDAAMLRVLAIIASQLVTAWNARPWTPILREIVLLAEPEPEVTPHATQS